MTTIALKLSAIYENHILPRNFVHRQSRLRVPNKKELYRILVKTTDGKGIWQNLSAETQA